MVAESDESPIYNIVYSTKIRISIDGREEIRTSTNLRFVVSVESPINIHVLRLYVFIKRGTDARRFELYFHYHESLRVSNLHYIM